MANNSDIERGKNSRGGGNNLYNYSSGSYYIETGDKQWTSWLIPMFVVANVAVFVVAMYINNCPRHSSGCVARFLGRLSFQPLKENPLFGPSSTT